jgi:site-specific DNA recombinase
MNTATAVQEQVLVYLRISEDRTGEEAGVERQRADCFELCERLGFLTPQVFVDNDVSAFKGTRRPGYQALLERVVTGPARVVVWHVDRLYRRPRELEDLIDLVESSPIRLEAVKGGAFDLNTHEGRLMARQLVAIASYESGHKADRIRRANQQKAERGDWHGAPRFGYGPGGVVVPREAMIVREMADRFLAGHTLRAITRWLNDESGVAPPMARKGTSGVWHATTVKSILSSARISGQRAYDPDREGREPPEGRAILGTGNWQPIITPAETARIRAMLGAPDRRTSASSIRLLSAIATCGRCGAGLVSGTNPRARDQAHRRRYICKRIYGIPERGGLSVSAYPVERLVEEAVITRLANTKLIQPTSDEGDPEARAAVDAVVEARQRIEDLAREYGAGRLTRQEFQLARGAANASIEEAERALARTAKTNALSGLPVGDEIALRAAWSEWLIPQRRAILSALIDSLVVRPQPPRGPRFNPDRVELRFKV